MSESSQFTIAVLIDGESLPASAWPQIREASEAIGKANIIRVFGDFTNGSHTAWLHTCREEGIEPVMHCPGAPGKNGTDMVMTIAAMDLAHSGYKGAMLLASNDRDFLPLARRLRAGGTEVHGLALHEANVAESAVFSSWCVIPASKRPLAKPSARKPTADPRPIARNGQSDLAQALVEIMADKSFVTLSHIGTRLAAEWPGLHKSIGKNKLKSRILKDVPSLKVDALQVRKA